MLGHRLWKHLHTKHDVWATLRRSFDSYSHPLFDRARTITGFDAANTQQLIKAFKAAEPDLVVNCIGIIKQLKEAHNTPLSLEINALLPHRIAEVAALAGARLIHISTDCVFSGKKGNYTEKDTSDAEDIYGRTKFLGEISYSDCLTLRTSIIGHELETKSGLIEWFLGEKGKEVKGFRRAIYSGFTTVEMARIIELVAVRAPTLEGVWQASSEPINKFELLRLVAEHYKWPGALIPDDTFVCDRSLNSDAFRKATGYTPPSWPEMVRELASEHEIGEVTRRAVEVKT